jgi:hypothetical protein
MSFPKNGPKFSVQNPENLFTSKASHDGPPFIDADRRKPCRSEWGPTPFARLRKSAASRRPTSARSATGSTVDNGPSGENLVALVRHSDAVLETVLGLSGRQYLLPVAGILGLRDQLDALVHAIDDLRVH